MCHEAVERLSGRRRRAAPRTLALAEAGTLALPRESVDLGAWLQDVVAASEPRAAAAGVALTVECAVDLPALEIDPVRVRQVVTNLVTNALQHTAPGGRIRVDCQRDAAAKAGEVWISVADSGTDISPEDLPHIFARFYKAKDSRGTGLGLAIAQQLVLLHGGRIEAESPGQCSIDQERVKGDAWRLAQASASRPQ